MQICLFQLTDFLGPSKGKMKPGPLLLVLVGAIVSDVTEGRNREYFIGINEVEWDYAPSGRNIMKGVPLEEDEDAAVFTTQGENTIGRRYKKVVYREYQDETFKTLCDRPPHWGLLGPVLRAEVDDILIVQVRNFASRNYSAHPHGVFYKKEHEGALYKDGTTLSDKMDDQIPPGRQYTYEWEARPQFGPTSDDPDCLTWAYHSHLTTHRDTNAGLVGPLLVCRPGTLDDYGNRVGDVKEYILFLTVFDENESWYLDDNIQTYCSNPDSVDKEDDDFLESNKMHGMNGLMYGNLDGLTACQGDTVSWHLLGLGTEVDIHSVHFQGQTVMIREHRQDTVSIFPAIFTTAMMQADDPGIWEITCLVNDHLTAGMNAKFDVQSCEPQQLELQSDGAASSREYFIGIHLVYWDYGPSGMNLMTNQNLNEYDTHSKIFFETSDDRIGGVYKKAIYFEYESGEFETLIPGDSTRGILGPPISLEVGESIRITLRNFATEQTYNIEPHGLFFDHTTAVAPGEQHTYVWTATESVAPTGHDRDCVTYLYTSTVDNVKDTSSGLVGPLLVCKQGARERYLATNSSYLLFTVFDENLSHYLAENIEIFTLDPSRVDINDDDFKESNLMHSINGRMYGNLQGIELCINSDNYIHMIGLGTEVDMHAILISSQNMGYRSENVGAINVIPHTTAAITVKPEHVLNGIIQCSTLDHYLGGMMTTYSAIDCGYPAVKETESGVTRTYYIAAVDEEWDFFPDPNEALGKTVDDATNLNVFIHRERGSRIGSKYLKALYYEYTDSTFTIRKEKSPGLGILGPVISAEEGDLIEIVFKNMARRKYSIATFGSTTEQDISTFPIWAEPGETVTHYWKVAHSSLPKPDQPECNCFLYMSVADEVTDPHTGLIGPLKICRKGTLAADGSNTLADREFFLLFFVVDENLSNYLNYNIRQFADADPETFDKEDGDFMESNLMHGINGRLEHVESLEMYEGERVIWHVMGLGNEVDLHTVHFHAHALNHTTDVREHGDVFTVVPMQSVTLEMNADAVGTWLLHCHVNDHMTAGMKTTYTVHPKKDNPRHKPSCYAKNRRIHSYELYCHFADLQSSKKFVKESHSDTVKICVYSEDDESCSETTYIGASEVYYLDLACDFDLPAETFSDVMRLFYRLRKLNAANLGLSSLQPGTFQSNRILARINLKNNQLRTLPSDLFSKLPEIVNINLRNNKLSSVEMKPAISGTTAKIIKRLIPFGVTAVVDLRNNPGLGTLQRVHNNRSG